MNLRELLRGRDLILLDGAMGTQLAAGGFAPGGAQNLLHPEAVRSIHDAYLRAGARGIITNTLTDNRIFTESHGITSDVSRINTAGAALARAAVEHARAAAGGTTAGVNADAFVLGDLSSTGQLLEPYGDFTEEQFIAAFKEQALILAGAGVEGFIVETVMDLREAVCALRGCKGVSALPVLVTLSFQTLANGGRTAMGNSAEECARTLTREGADAIGANCGDLDPFEIAEMLPVFRAASDLPLVVQPNAGKPRLVDGKARFDMEPARFAEGLARCIERGARVVGGCCGTSPAHISAAARLLFPR
ncbi:MAG: homocysteine S-methyltransferase family protein [Spirochaetia bacterium]|jgi:5-methyltetrahydrofolate--homocysteine methyltransferase